MELNDIKDETILDDIFSKELIVYENVKGDATIYVKYDGENIFHVKTDMKNDDINFIDNSTNDFYGKALNFFQSLDERIKSLLTKRYWYVFEYFSENMENCSYIRLPQHNLVLTGIIKNDKLNFNVDEIEEYARLLELECLPFIFKGKLNEKTIEVIKYYLNTSKEDLEYVFEESSFAYFFYKLLNPQMNSSFLMDDNFNDNIDKIILKIDGEENNFEILNRLYDDMSNNKTEYYEVYSIILMNTLIFFQSINFNAIKLKYNKKNEAYDYLICVLFNKYIENVKDDILKWDFVIPEFINKQKFTINKEIILNNITKKYMMMPKLGYIFKCMYFSYNNLLEEVPFGILSINSIKLFNAFVEFLRTFIDEHLKKYKEDILRKNGLVSFDKWIDIKYDVDSENKVYPNISQEIEKGEDKKKKKGFYGGKPALK